MSQNPDFLNNFQNSLDRLANLNSIIEENNKGKQEFSEVVFRRLREINEKIRSLGNKIKDLKDKLATLEQQVSMNNVNIENRDANVNRLQSQIERLTAERDELKKQIVDINQRSQAELQNLQQRIDQSEAQIRQLTEQNANLNQQIQELNNAATQRGNEAAAQSQAIQEHATKMEEQRQQHAAELEQMKQQNSAQMEQLKQQIEEKDRAMTELQANTAAEIQRLNEQLAALTQEKDASQAQIAQLQQQIQQLTDQNNNLIQRIISATDAINEAMNALEKMNNPAELQQNLQQATALFQEVEASLENIFSAIHGRKIVYIGDKNLDEIQNMPDNINNDSIINIDNQGNTMRYGELKDGLLKKVKQKPDDPNFKYRLALKEIKSNPDPNKIPEILMKYGISFNNGVVVGGKKYRKTRKIRKQKGGFIYNTPSSRKKRSSLTKTSKIPSSLRTSNSYSSSDLFKTKRQKKNNKRTSRTSKRSS